MQLERSHKSKKVSFAFWIRSKSNEKLNNLVSLIFHGPQKYGGKSIEIVEMKIWIKYNTHNTDNKFTEEHNPCVHTTILSEE